MNDVLSIYIGFDQREAEAWDVCRKSLERRATTALHIVKLEEKALRYNEWYSRPWHMDGKQKIDDIDGRPFSTDFAFTRFLVPALALNQGWALFCDSDFLFTADIAGLFDLADPKYAAMVVKHDHAPSETVKMDGIAQGQYFRKNWSSLVLWNCEHPANQALTTQAVNFRPGRWLHAFEWLKDEEIGALPLTWNWLAGASDPLPEGIPCGVHFTGGGPWFEDCQHVPYGELWTMERDSRRAMHRPLPTEQLRALG